MNRVRRFFVFLVNRVEHQKRTQTATKWWPFGFVFGDQLGSLEKKYGVNRFMPCWFNYDIKMKKEHPVLPLLMVNSAR